ncbi:MAG: UvrB/UvrC motif-containing protein [Firmicutes bacterium]|nr:UvrB/UvrC motif-containing protein [Bacillota bacterium]
MLCQACGQAEATVHVTRIVNGEKTESHLCEQCAREQGEAVLLEPVFSFHKLLGGLLEPEADPAPAEAVGRAPVRCPNCGLTFSDFKRLGHLGCSECYETFQKQLEPVLRRIHGSTAHAGKIPARTGGALRRRRELNRLRQELHQAVAKEEYERAAEIRDRIRALERDLRPGG